MLFKIDLWNPRKVSEESDISAILQSAATDLYEKVKTADNSGQQDMVICMSILNGCDSLMRSVFIRNLV